MKSKTHSKKCMEMGVSVSSVEDADTEDSGKVSVFSCNLYFRWCVRPLLKVSVVIADSFMY